MATAEPGAGCGAEADAVAVAEGESKAVAKGVAEADAEGGALTVRGEGVDREVVFSREELEKMSIERHTYSVINNFPTERLEYTTGVPLRAILELAGLNDSAKLLTFISADGYQRTFTVAELFAPRYFFPVEGDKKAVPAIVSLQGSDSGFDALETINLRLIMGQRARSEQNNPWFVRDLSAIEVSSDAPGSWPAVTFNRTVGPDGVVLELRHPSFDSVKIYYTTDGSAPTVESKMYNISATRFQPQLNQPLLISRTTVVRAIAIGPGLEDSAVASLTIPMETAMFDDLAGYGWASEAIGELAEKGIVNGVGNNKFDPGGNLSRAMFVTMLGRAFNAGAPPVSDRRFGDVEYDSWYGSFVEWAVDEGYVLGYEDGTFRPGAYLLVEHMLLIAERAGLEGAPEGIDAGARRTATRAEAAVIIHALMLSATSD